MKVTAKTLPALRSGLLQIQNFECAICQTDLSMEPTTNQHVDHNHVTGKIRGVLCRACNLLEGNIQHFFTRVGHQKKGTDIHMFLRELSNYLGTETIYEHPSHKSVMVKRFKRLNKPEQIQLITEELTGKETKKDLQKIYKRQLR